MSQLQVNQINDASGGVLAPISSIMRNRIINGNFVLDQRNNGASVSVSGGAYTLDRWVYDPSASLSWFTFQQNGGGVTPPAGFSNYLGITSTGANTPTSGQFTLVSQYIEGFNTADFGWGTANASTITLSFWVRSSLTGTFGGALGNSAFNRSYPFTYTISAANTWEQKSITIPGDTTGTWVGATNGLGLRVIFGLGVGSSSLGPAGAWAGATYRSATGATNVSATSGATFYLTGVQLEKGTQATSFEYRQYTTELQLCQRYYYKITPTSDVSFSLGFGRDTTRCIGFIAFPTTMRTAPTALEQSGTASHYAQVNMASGGESVCSSVPTLGARTVASSTFNFFFSSGITIGSSGLVTSNNAAGFLAWSAEL